jgi:hypothetical protein
MQSMQLLFPVHVPGTLAANITFHFKAPFDLQLIGVQAVGSNAHDATLKVGTTSDDDAYLTAKNVGDSAVSAEWDRDDFVGTQFPHISAGTVILVTVDYDGSSGTAVQNLTVVLIFTAG